MEALQAGRKAGGKVFRRQRSRLQMHAPSSIQVGPAAPAATVAEWNAAIPLLSPLDTSATFPPLDADDRSPENTPDAGGAAAPATEEEVRSPDGGPEARAEEGKSGRWPTWQHPAEPFYYEPVPGKAPVFFVPHCA